MDIAGTALATIGGSFAVLDSGITGIVANQPTGAIFGSVAFFIGLAIKFEKQIQAALGTPQSVALIDSIGNDIEALKNSHGSLSDRIAALEAANTDVPTATATAINPTQPTPVQNA